jgi:chromatin remodeling complex protein RSC6
MKASEIKKDLRTTIRISSQVKESLRLVLNMSVQEAFDKFIDNNLFFELLPNQGQNNQEKTMAKKVTKKAVKNDKKKPGKTKASKQSGGK